MGLNRSNLKRQRIPMPDFIQQALEGNGLMKAYQLRPDYQQNDYLAWITRAKHPATVQKRLDQMLSELKQGGVYMNMKHPPSSRN